MFDWLKPDPLKKLNTRRLALLKEARDLQRAGKIPEFAAKTAEAEELASEIEKLRAQSD